MVETLSAKMSSISIAVLIIKAKGEVRGGIPLGLLDPKLELCNR